MQCEICDNELASVYQFLNSPIPNDYYLKPGTISCEQRILFCDTCFYVKNFHQFDLEQIFNNYLYRSPKSNQDQGTIDFLKHKIQEFRIKNIVEIGGNNGVFAEKLLEQAPEILALEIWDRVPLAIKNDRITHNDQYLSESSISKKEVDLVIVRHAFAHNPSIGGHPAFTIKDLLSLTARLDKEKILYSDAKVYAMPSFHQIYLYDINANMLEINQAV